VIEIARGAEAVISKAKEDELEIVVKDRVKKGYRVEQLDAKIRKERTKLEARLLREASRAGVNAPRVVEEKGTVLKIEFVEGRRVKEILRRENIRDICSKIGLSVARLHAAGIVHGDLTTSNMIMKDGELFFIDFGLGFMSSAIEDQATDLHVLDEALRSTHFEIAEDAFDAVLESYAKEYDKAKDVIDRLGKIETRGRYVRRREKD